MTLAGWIIMLLACGSITGLLIGCIRKVISTPESYDHLHAQTDIDPHDPD
jgi:hypothetical protein